MEIPLDYACHAFHESLPNGKAAGELHFTVAGLSYKVGELVGNLPFSQLNFKLGGASNRLVFINHPLKPDLILYTSDLSILKNPLLMAHPECALQIHAARKLRHKAWFVFAAIAFVICALPAYLLWNMEKISGLAAKKIPVEWETKLGESVAAQYAITHKLMDKETLDANLTPLVNPLLQALSASPYRYKFTIVNESSLNAFALPGGFVTIHTGLILKAETAEELLGVLAHEMSHVEERHGIRSIVGNAGIYMVASIFLGDVTGVLATVSSAAPMLMSQQYSRTFETDADEKAAALMLRANVNPEGLPRFFEKMIAEEKAMLDKIENKEAQTAIKKAMTFLSTHPASEQRMIHLRQLIPANNNNYQNLNNEFLILKTAVKSFVENTPAEVKSETISNHNSSITEKESNYEGNH